MIFEQWLQSRLTAHRVPVGPIDGKLGPVTIAAIRAFQRSHGMEPTGRADEHTVALLRAPSSAVMPEVRRQPVAWPRERDCMQVYGPVGTRQTQIEIPFDMYLAWDRSRRIRRMTLHELVAPSALRVFQRVGETYPAAERAQLGIDVFGGSLNVRRKRGGTSYSMHSWGIAIDFDPERNQLHQHRPAARLSHADALPFWQAWEAEGWLSLGRARDYDWMHVQAARL